MPKTYPATNPKKFLDADGLAYFSTKLNSYPTNEVIEAVVDGVQDALDEKIDVTSIGAANGVASLDSTGKVPASQLPVQSTYEFDQTYDPTTNKAATVKTVTNAIEALDGGNIGTPGVGKTITSLTQTNGNVSAAFGDIKITKSQVSDFPTLGTASAKNATTSIATGSTSTDLPTSAAVASFVEGKGYKTTDNNTTYTLTQDATDGHKITLTPSTGTATTITIPDNNTTYSDATQSTHGLMSVSDKKKLDGIAAGATANTGTITGITMNGVSKGTSGVVDLGTVITAHQDISGKADIADIPTKVSQLTNDSGFTTNTGTITGIKMNGASKGTSGVVDLGTVITSHQDISGKLNVSLKGANNGLAELDANGKVPTSQLPSYVDDVLEFTTKDNFPLTGETGKIYVNLADNKTYRWGGSEYVEISPSLALGTTSSTAFRGDYGNAAYTHASAKGSAYAAGLYKITTNSEGHVTNATAVAKADITALGIPAQDTTYTFDGTYNASTNKAATVDTVKNAINALDGGEIGTGGVGKTITSLSQENGNVSATFGNISITKSQVSDLGTIGAAAAKGVDSSITAGSTSTNLPTAKAVASFVEGKGYKTTDNNTTYTISQDSTDGHKFTLSGSDGSSTTITIPDNDHTYTLSSLGIGNVKNYDQSKAIKSITRSGTTFTYTCLDNTTGTFTQQDNNTWTAFVGASSTADGTAGYVPAAGKGNHGKFFRGDGTWAVPTNTNTTYSIAQDSTDGHKFTLSGSDGSETTITIPDNNTTYSSKTAASGGADVSLVTTGEKYTWNNKSNLAIGTSATTAAAGNHTHGIGIATSTGTNQITLAANTKYSLTAGGQSYVFTTPPDNNTDTKVTSVGNHYAPSADDSSKLTANASGATAAWSIDVVKGISIDRDAKGHVTGVSVVSGKIPGNPNTDTKNTAGSTDSSKKLFLIGAESQAANPQTYSHDTAYVGTDGCLYSGGTKVLTAHQDISGKADKSATVSNVAYDSTNKKLTKTINGTTSDVVTVATLKTAMSLAKGDVGLGNVENKSSATIRGEITSSNVTTALGFTPMNANLKGANSGVAELDANGKVPTSQLPSFVDDVLEYDTSSSFPTTGETGKIYIAQDTNKTYRWSGTAYVEISASLALGETSSTAYRGDRGKTAYDHASAKGSAFSEGLYKITTNAQGHVTAATAVAKADITALGIPGSDTNTHRPIQVNGTEVLGNNTTALNLKAGSNVSVTNSSGTVTISATDTTYSSKAAASGGTDLSLVTTGEKATWNAKTSNTGTVTSVATGVGLTGGTITGSGTIKAKLKSETASTLDSAAMGSTASRQYAVGVDKSGYLSVNVPWTDNNTNTTYSLTQDSTDGHKITLTPSSGTAQTITIPDNNTWRPVSDSVSSTSSSDAASSKAVKTAYDLAASKTANTGTVTSVATGAGLTGGTITATGTIKANLTSETMLSNAAADGTETAGRVYPVRLDKNGKLAVNVPWVDTNTQTITGVKGNAETSYRTGNVNITPANIGASASNHTHTTSIATSTGTNQITLAASTKYAITAGGTSYVFTTPPNTTYSAISNDEIDALFA